MVGTSALLQQAAREVQIADHLLTVTYRFTGDLKVLFRVMAHACNAIDDTVMALGATASDVSLYGSVSAVYASFSHMISQFDYAPMVFRRKQSLVVASDGFAEVKEVRSDEIERGLQTVKQFVFHAGKHMVVSP